MNMNCPACNELFTPKPREGGRHLVLICDNCETVISGTQVQVTIECTAKITVPVEIPGGIGLTVADVDRLMDEFAVDFPLSDQWTGWDSVVKYTYPNIYGKFEGE